MASRLTPNMLTKEQWQALRDLAIKENKPSGDVALELIRQALDAQIPSNKPDDDGPKDT